MARFVYFLLLALTLPAMLPASAPLSPALAYAAPANDPLEPYNRAMFWFNDQADIYVLEPVARGYKYILPRPVRNGVGNFFENIEYPVYLVSDLIQLKFDQVGLHTGRFVINTTLGVLGVMDIAKEFGLKKHKEDFGTALGYQGVPEGPYFVIPILGPSNIRDTGGRIVDQFLNPTYYFGYTNMRTATANTVSASLTALRIIDARHSVLDAVEGAKDASVDYYGFMRNSYHQIRQNLIYDNDPPIEEEEVDYDAAERKALDKLEDAQQLPAEKTTK